MSSIKQELATDIFGFFANPAGFVRYAFPWGVAGTELEHFQGPDEWHLQQFAAIAEHVKQNIFRQENGMPMEPYQDATASGHGIGKSADVAWLILWLMSTRPKCRGVVTANTSNQLEGKTWPELQKWHRLAINKDWFKWTATKFYCVLEPEGEKQWCFEAVPWSEEKTEAFAGLHNAGSSAVLIFDEASGIPDLIWEVAEGAMTDGEPFWFVFGNPTRNTGRFRQCFGKLRHRWKTRHVDSRSVRITNKAVFAKWVEDYGEDSDFVRIRVRGQFPRGSNKQFISSDLVEGAQQREVRPDPGAALIMGVDTAREGEDEFVIRFRRGRDARSIPPIKYRELTDMQGAYRVAEAIDKHKPDEVCIDAGMGTGVIDRLRELGYRVHEVWFGASSPSREYANMRSSLWGRLKAWLPGGAIDGDDALHDDLIGPEYSLAGTEGDQIQLESKKAMKKRGLSSPDNGDALAVTFYVRASRKDTATARQRQARVARDVDYSVFG